MRPEHSGPRQIGLAWVERLADALFDLAGDQDVRVIEALAAVLGKAVRKAMAGQARDAASRLVRSDRRAVVCERGTRPGGRRPARHLPTDCQAGAAWQSGRPDAGCHSRPSHRRQPALVARSVADRHVRTVPVLSPAAAMAGGRLANPAQPEPAADRRSRPVIFSEGSESPLGLRRVRIDSPSRPWRLFSAFR